MQKHLCAAVLATLALATSAFSQTAVAATSSGDRPNLDNPQFVVSSQGDCVVLGPKKHLFDGQITQVEASPNGQFVVAQRIVFTAPQYFDLLDQTKNPPTLQTRITLANVKTGRTVDLPYDPVKARIYILNLSDAGIALLDVNNGTSDQIISFNSSGKTNAIVPASGATGAQPTVFPLGKSGGSLLVLTSFEEDPQTKNYIRKTKSAGILDAQGNLVKDITRYVSDFDSVFPNPADESSVCVYAKKTWYAVNINSGARTPTDRPDFSSLYAVLDDSKPHLNCTFTTKDRDKVWKLFYNEPSNTSAPTAAASGTPPSTQQTTQKPAPKAKPESAAIGVNLANAQVSQNQSAVFLADSGGLDCIPLQPVDLDVYNALLKNRIKQDAMSNAKQVGTAMLIYGSDYDDTYPLSGNWSDAVMPYIKNRDLLNNFQYLMNGESASSIENPASTEMGVVSTQYGEAVVYADGHVKWRDNNPPSAFILTLLADPKYQMRT